MLAVLGTRCMPFLQQEPDFAEWSDRLWLMALDMRHVAALEAFCSYLQQKLPHLDVLINNACQTIRRPPAYYQHLLQVGVSVRVC